jgi:predicted RNA-binding Zn-ribbon protein involved in translation (DUF1610 family)
MNECPKCRKSMPYLNVAKIIGKYFSEGDEQSKINVDVLFLCPLCGETVAKDYETADKLLTYE